MLNSAIFTLTHSYRNIFSKLHGALACIYCILPTTYIPELETVTGQTGTVVVSLFAGSESNAD